MSTTITELAESCAAASDGLDAGLTAFALAVAAINRGDIADALQLLNDGADAMITAYEAVELPAEPITGQPWIVPLAPYAEDLTR